MKQKIIIFINILVLILMLFVLTGCSLKPTYISESTIKKHVKNNYGKDYKLVNKTSYEDDTDEKNLMYEYVFENKKGNSFSIYSYTQHITVDASKSIFYTGSLSDNYVEKKVEDNHDKIDRILQATNCTYTLNTWNFQVNLYSFLEIDKISKALYDILIVLDLEENQNTDKEYYKISDSLSAAIILHSGTERITGNVELKYGLTENDIKKDLESDFMNYIANYNKYEEFDVPEEKWNTFHTQKAVYNYGKFDTIDFYYDEELGDYYTSSFGLCLNYDKYDYNHNDTLQDLVELNDGTFFREGWTNTWIIGDDLWNATMTLDAKGDFKDLKVTKNGEKLNLQYYTQGNTNIFQQCFTRKTIEDLLGVTITINNDGTAEIY